MGRHYVPMDRGAARRDPTVLERAAVDVRAFFDAVDVTFEPDVRLGNEDAQRIAELREDSAAAFSDRDWIEGYRAGLADGARAERGEAEVGPSATPNGYDGWSPSVLRREAYALGRADYTTR